MMDVSFSGALPFGLKESAFLHALEAAMRKAKKKPVGIVSVNFVTDRRMQTLNRTYRGKDKTTDVLSFGEPEVPVANPKERVWGDIFISPTYVKKEAARRSISPQEETLRMAVHGMLHLLGYDHATEEEELVMFTLQEKALASIDL